MMRHLIAAGLLAAATTAAVSISSAAPAAFATSQSAAGHSAARHSGTLSVTISGLPRHPALTLGGPAVSFTVTIRNGTTKVQRNVAPVVAIDHCTCSHTPVELGPAGTLQEFDQATGKWRTVTYDLEGTGMDYLGIVQQSPVTLAPGASDNFKYRLAFASNTKQPLKLTAGQTGILASLVREPLNWNDGDLILASDDVQVSVTP
jgi:hypothetical protein